MENDVGSSSDHYDTDDFITDPQQVEKGTIHKSILEFHYSYGYNCRRYFNFCVPDPNTIIYVSGCLIHIFDTISRKLNFRRASTGSGIGHITKNPIIAHIAVGENGIKPSIIIYNWPNFGIVTILYDRITRIFSHLSYSPDGNLLVSQGGEPNYLISIWNWREMSIMLRCKSYIQDIHNVIFSSSISGHITTAGIGHIKSWRMTSTFTGLKLKGELGRFGRTEISNIIGVLTMPDGKIVSGCEWGNILVWDEGQIKLEVHRKNRKSCHNAMITQFEYKNGELISIGMDGWIRFWYYDTIDQADPSDNNRFLDIEPIYEFKIGDDTTKRSGDVHVEPMLMSLQKKDPDNLEETLWYAQDGNGGFWLIDMNTSLSSSITRSQKLFTCHASAVNDIAPCTWGEFIATCGEDGRLNVYNYVKKKMIVSHTFRDVGTCVVWFSCTVESSGSTLACAFKSGILRMITISIAIANESHENEHEYVQLIQVIKPHTESITNMSVNPANSLLITCSEDSTMFIFSIGITDKYPLLVPIGFVNMPSSVTCMSWKPQYSCSILVGCSHGECIEVDLPEVPQTYTTVSYELALPITEILRIHSARLKNLRGITKVETKENRTSAIPMLHEKIDTLGSTIDRSPPSAKVHVPQINNRILTINYSESGTIYLTMSGSDAGFFYEYSITSDNIDLHREPIKCIAVHDAIHKEIHSCLFYHHNYLIMGLEQGEIRVCRLKNRDWTDLSDYWTLPMHDRFDGHIAKIILSYDAKMLFTCGHDGNIFSFIVDDDSSSSERIVGESASPLYSFPESHIDDIEEADHPNLEQSIKQNEERKVLLEANEKKDCMLIKLRGMREEYRAITEENSMLLETQQIPHDEFQLDLRITEDLDDQLESEMNAMHVKMAFETTKSRLKLDKLTNQFIKPITCIPFAVAKISKPNRMVYSLREKFLDQYFATNYIELLEQLENNEEIKENGSVKEDEFTLESVVQPPFSRIETVVKEQREENINSFLKNFTPSMIQFESVTQFNHLSKRYHERREKLERRAHQWKLINSCKPDANVNGDENIEAIEEVKRTIGEYKLKIAVNCERDEESTCRKISDIYKLILHCRKKSHYLRVDFNGQLKSIRNKKLELQHDTLSLIEKLKRIHTEIPYEYIRTGPETFKMNLSIEYPERNLELQQYITVAERVRNARRIRKSTLHRVNMVSDAKEYEILLSDGKSINNENSTIPMGPSICGVGSQITIDETISLHMNDYNESTWEYELKLARIEKKIYEQDRILDYLTRSSLRIDKDLDEFERKRCAIQTDSSYSKLHYLMLHRKLIILRDYENKEDFLTKKFEETLMALTVTNQKIQCAAASIEKNRRAIVKLQDEIEEISWQFSNKIRGNKFVDFLSKIFKKKYKPHREAEVNIDSGENDVVSTGSQERELNNLDENICPTDCDQELYNAALMICRKRYEYESQIIDNQNVVEILRHESVQSAKELKVIENSLVIVEQELSAFMIEKQKKLNDIDATVVLNLHQFQHFDDDEMPSNICDCVVFDEGKLSQLNTRVSQLQQEAINQIIEHKKNQVHLNRMKIDCEYMNDKMDVLNGVINEEMFNKFGERILLTDLYEAVLGQIIVDIKCDTKTMMKFYNGQIYCVKKKYNDQCIIYENLIQENTEKLSFLTVLEEEYARLGTILKQIPKSIESMSKIERDYKDELKKLEVILANQRQQTKLFRYEIRNLDLKLRPLPSPYSRVNSRKSM